MTDDASADPPTDPTPDGGAVRTDPANDPPARTDPANDPPARTDPANDSPANRQDDDGDAGPPTTGAESVVAALEDAGVEHAFGVQGGAIMPVYDALHDAAIDHVTMAHEQGAAHAADAYGVVTGLPGVCFATSGPGATNLVTGIADADMDSDPVVALTGQVPTEFVGNDAFQETDATGMTTPVTKANYFVDDPATVGDDVGEAMALSVAGRPGPTLVDLPKDVTQEDLPKDVTGAGNDDTPGDSELPSNYDPPESADPAAVAAAAERIEAAESPVLLLGGGVIKAEATAAWRAFATEHGIPVVTTMPAVGAFPEDHDLALEMAGMHGTGYANMAITHCDTLIAVGCRFDDRLTGGVESFAPAATVVHVDIDPAEISKNVAADHPVVGDAGTVADQFHDA
ncbi:MAG: thiamine pyrophosphate-binding protein, partial [Halobacteriales archaeon]